MVGIQEFANNLETKNSKNKSNIFFQINSNRDVLVYDNLLSGFIFCIVIATYPSMITYFLSSSSVSSPESVAPPYIASSSDDSEEEILAIQKGLIYSALN